MTNPETQKPVEEIASSICTPSYSGAVFLDDMQHVMDVKDALLSERQIAEKLREQLPEGMKDCTIIFKQCSLGHGWLTAKNWIQHECLTCERDGLREQVSGLVKLGQELLDEYIVFQAKALGGASPTDIMSKFAEHLTTLPSHHLEISKAKEDVIEAARYLVWPSKYESRSEVCHECGTYGVGDLREAFANLKSLQAKQEESK